MVQGLGTADMKSGCAALVEAFVACAEHNCLPDDAALFLVVGEEETGDGTEAILDTWTFPHALIAEPTDLLPCLSHHGYLEVLTRTYGLRRHASQSGPETNATLSMLRVLHQFTSYLEQYYASITMNIRDLHSSESGFAVPDRCEAWMDLHMPAHVTMETLISSVQEHLNQQFESGRASSFDLEFTTQAPGFEIDSTGYLPMLLRRLFGQHERPWHPTSFASHSDACLLHDAGCAPLIIGPGQLARAHTRDETVPLEQVMQAADMFLELLHLQQTTDFTD
jgi:acetylornithine deacetylase